MDLAIQLPRFFLTNGKRATEKLYHLTVFWLRWRIANFCVARQNCNIIGQHGKDTDTIRTTSLPPAHRKRSRPRVFSANIRLCLCEQISQLFLFFAPLHPQVTTEGVLEPPPPPPPPLVLSLASLQHTLLFLSSTLATKTPGTQDPVLPFVHSNLLLAFFVAYPVPVLLLLHNNLGIWELWIALQ